jgi:hypothetical protein
MSAHDHVPSIDEVQNLESALEEFAKRLPLDIHPHPYKAALEVEENIAIVYVKVVDALGAIRPLLGGIAGWRRGIEEIIRVIDREVQSLTDEWGWHRFNSEPGKRDTFLNETRRRFRRSMETPLCRQALAWETDFSEQTFHPDRAEFYVDCAHKGEVLKWAARGRELGVNPAKQKNAKALRESFKKCYTSPCFGKRRPAVTRGQAQSLHQAYIKLADVLIETLNSAPDDKVKCLTCLRPLTLYERRSRYMHCHKCRSFKGKVVELDIAIKTTPREFDQFGEDPLDSKFPQWAAISTFIFELCHCNWVTIIEWNRFKKWFMVEFDVQLKGLLSSTLNHLAEFLTALRRNEARKTDPIPSTPVQPTETRRKRRGRPKRTDVNGDERLCEQWDEGKKNGKYLRYEDMAKEIGNPADEIQKAIDRHRKRLRSPE